MVLDELGSSLQGALEKIAGKSRIDEEAVEEVVKDIQRALLRADVDVDLVNDISDSIRDRSLEEEPPKGTSAREHVLRIVYEEMLSALGGETEIPLEKQVILLAGLQGSGKTTSSAKLASWFEKKGLSPGIIQTDTYRPGAYDQGKQLAEEAGVPYHGDPEADNAVEIAKKGLEELQERDVIIVDTAGRHSLEEELIDEIEQIEKVVEPDINLLVLDASIGQGAGEQAQAFESSIGIDGVVLTKLDGTAKGGGALSAVNQTNSSVAFIGTGETIRDFEKFDADGFISRLLGMGDIKALVNRVEEAMQETETEEDLDPEKILQGEFTLKDVYSQMEAMSNMGPIDQVMDMLPGMGGLGKIKDELPEDFAGVTNEKMTVYRAIMDSMTDEEMENPKSIGASQVRRIAMGSGTSEEEVRELLEYYRTMERTMKQMGGGGGRQMKKMMEQMGGGDIPEL